MSAPLVVSMKEAAHRLGVSISFLYDELNRGRLPTVKLAKRRLIAVADLEIYVAANRQQPPAEATYREQKQAA